MDELIDIWDEDGNPTGESKLKSEAHSLGVFHPTVHIWFYTKSGKILLQQRGKDKKTFPLYWDVSVAGHISKGEAIEAAALREVKEEIGLNIMLSDLQFIGRFKSVHRHSEEFIDAEFHHTYLCELKTPFNELQKQDDEVETLKLMPLLKFAEETWGLASKGNYVPHEADYYKTVVKEISKRI